MSSRPAEGSAQPVAFLGDSHLLGDDGSTEAFLRFLESAPARFARLVLLGDLFDLWLARPHLHEPHHERVVDALRSARASGLVIDFIVGNRDFGVDSWTAAPFDRVGDALLDPDAPPSWVAEHGDLVNESDRQYRAWRRLARSAPVLGTFLRLPGRVGGPLSLWLERRMRTTNLDAKRRFPSEHVEQRARQWFEETGARHLVLGHFHVERRIEAGPGEVWILPDWKRSHRHAEWTGDAGAPGVVRFVDSFADEPASPQPD